MHYLVIQISHRALNDDEIFSFLPVFQPSFKLLTENRVITHDINNASLKSGTMMLLIMNAISSITTTVMDCINV